MGRLSIATSLTALCVTLLPPPAKAGIMTQIVTTDDGLGADAFVNGGTHADRNFGGRADLIVKNGSANVARKIYVRFDLSQLSFDGPLTEAALSLSVHTNDAPQDWSFNVWGLRDGAAGDQAPGAGGWLEGIGASSDPATNPDAVDGSITWNSAPANVVSSPVEFNGDATFLGTLFVTDQHGQGDAVTFSSPDLLAFLNDSTSNSLATLMLNRLEDFSGNTSFASREHATFAPPALSLTGPSPAAVPEPSSLVLLGLGVAGLAGYTRRRKSLMTE